MSSVLCPDDSLFIRAVCLLPSVCTLPIVYMVFAVSVGDLCNLKAFIINISYCIWLHMQQSPVIMRNASLRALELRMRWSNISCTARLELAIPLWRFHHTTQTWSIPIKLSHSTWRFFPHSLLISPKHFVKDQWHLSLWCIQLYSTLCL